MRLASLVAVALLSLACGAEDQGRTDVVVPTAGAAGTSAGSGTAGASGSGDAGAGTAGTSGAAGTTGATAGTAGASGAATAGAAGKSGGAGAAAAGAAGKGAGAAGAAGKAGSGGAAGSAGAGGMSGCPPEMLLLAAPPACVDRWEGTVEVMDANGWTPHSPYETLDAVSAPFRAVSQAGAVPQGYISGAQAKEACETAGKRLCSKDEHRAACRGPDVTTYPYGDTHVKGACNEGRAVHPVIEYFGPGVPFDAQHLNDPGINQQADTLTLTGEKTMCTNAYGAFDMSGNLHEWIDDPAGTFLGGFYVDAEINGPGCLYATTAHAFGYHDYSTGFRCCKDP